MRKKIKEEHNNLKKELMKKQKHLSENEKKNTYENRDGQVYS